MGLTLGELETFGGMMANECRWLGIFNGVSAFNNSGMSLLDANMVLASIVLSILLLILTDNFQIPFQTSIYTLITMGLMILAGNTASVFQLLLMLKLTRTAIPSSSV